MESHITEPSLDNTTEFDYWKKLDTKVSRSVSPAEQLKSLENYVEQQIRKSALTPFNFKYKT